ncbi:MAG: DNA polymerase III subunit delta [Pseudomonadota bacterium]
MKVAANRARGFAGRPDPKAAGFLIYGPDPQEVDDLRLRLVAALSARGEAEMTRMDPQEARRDPAALTDALRAAGLFGGMPILLLEGASDGVAPAIATATDGLSADMGALVVTAGQLPARSRLRKLFEEGEALAALPVFAQTLDRAGLEALLREQGVNTMSEDGLGALAGFAEGADPAEVRAVARTLGLYALDSERPLNAADVEALLPASLEGEVDAVVEATAARKADAALAAFARIAAQGAGAAGVALALGRHFRRLHLLCTASDGPEAAAGRLRPPVFGPRRDSLLRAARAWPPRAAETALRMILDAEFTLRSTGGPPDRAVVERLIVRLSMLRAN